MLWKFLEFIEILEEIETLQNETLKKISCLAFFKERENICHTTQKDIIAY